MHGNPYAALAKMIGSSSRAASSWILGEVVSTSPIGIEYAGAVLDDEDILLNAALAGTLNIGDTVILFPDESGEHFFAAAKVVQ